MQKPQRDPWSNQLATSPRNVISGVFWAYLIENLILSAPWPFTGCETWIRSQSSTMTVLHRQGRGGGGAAAAAAAANNRLITVTMSGNSVSWL